MTMPQRPTSSDLARIVAIDLESYLVRAGWEEVDRADRVATWVLPRGKETLRVVLPVRHEAEDYADLAYEALRVLAFAEQRSLGEVLADVEYGGADVVSVRLTPDAPSGQAPLTVAQAAVSALKAFVVGSAAGLEAKSAVLPSRRPRAERYAGQVRLSTSHGSFVLTLAMPLREMAEEAVRGVDQTTIDEIVDIPAALYGRQVVKRMRTVASTALALAREITEGQEDLTVFEADPPSSGNATELEALAGLGGRSRGQYQLRFTYSPVAPEPESRPTTVSVQPEEQELFAKAAKLLRDRKPKDDVAVTGVVVRLTRELGFGPGEVVIRGMEVGSRTAHRYRTPLSEDQYNEALAAHRRGLEVAARGRLALHGNFLTLESLMWFMVQQELPNSQG